MELDDSLIIDEKNYLHHCRYGRTKKTVHTSQRRIRGTDLLENTSKRYFIHKWMNNTHTVLFSKFITIC